MKRNGKTHINQQGFTIIELVVVLILLSIFAPVVMSRFGNNDAELITQTDTLKSYLRYAQIKAMNDTVPWGINLTGNTVYTLYKKGIKATNPPYYLPGESNKNPAGDPLIHTLTNNITLKTGVGTTIAFNEWGVPVDGSGAPVISNITIELSDGAQTRSITVTKNTGFLFHDF
ncbi:pilus assembly FimT family protein [Desulfobacterium sp. N47]|uniref:Prepilin-type N-terminal cleavage/methylation domain-containing protein n=1 Tax=uncultured Desulfobacterium sp. TaxID=201089 RepID=E1YCU1_9BACT|nr:hypothetical protein N47_G37090 [uncultured Desulfobacterium sp.]